MPNDFAATITTEFDEDFESGGAWDRLVNGSNVDSIFLSSGWLRAWRETLGAGARLVVPRIHRDGELVAAAALQVCDGVVEFAGSGPSDYADFVVSKQVDATTTHALIRDLIRLAVETVPDFRHLRLSGVVLQESATPAVLDARASGLFAVEVGRTTAPFSDLRRAELGKIARRRARTLAKAGASKIETFTRADDILPQLDDLFSQHIRRWEGTRWPSRFTEEVHREFFGRLTAHLGRTGAMRFTTIRLDGRPAAMHFGFRHRHRFFYYTATYEQELRTLSPGTVLLEQLLQIAKTEGALEFDLLLGEESYKQRFATGSRTVADLHVTTSALRAALKRTMFRARASAGRLKRTMLPGLKSRALRNAEPG